MAIESQTAKRGAFRQVLHVGAHTLHADISREQGGESSAPGAHDYFDASLAVCKALTTVWYSKKHGMALERVETKVERDDSRERQGTYGLRVKLAFHGALSPEERQRLYAVVGHCPIHKLMTTTESEITTEPSNSELAADTREPAPHSGGHPENRLLEPGRDLANKVPDIANVGVSVFVILRVRAHCVKDGRQPGALLPDAL